MKFVPTPQDYLKCMVLPPWIHNGVKDIENPEATQYADEIKLKLQIHE